MQTWWGKLYNIGLVNEPQSKGTKLKIYIGDFIEYKVPGQLRK
jgi:hypothetical protein